VPIELSVQGGPYEGVDPKAVRRIALAMLRTLQLQYSSLSIVITDDNSIRELNRDYRHKDKATDVLAFPMREGEFGALAGPLLGDVVISIPTAERQARERRVSTFEEVTMLLAHGLLHLLGWNHDTAAKDRAMRAETDRLCSAADAPVRRPSRRRVARSTSDGSDDRRRRDARGRRRPAQ
jgi:probable rRNA maturation factor